MVLTSKLVIPVVLGVSLCGVSAVLLYILLKKDEDELKRPGEEVESSQFTTKEITIPKEVVSVIIGRGGTNIRELEQKTGARITLNELSSGTEDRICTIRGNHFALSMAENLIQDVIKQQKNLETVSISIPHWSTGKIIGRGGENINNISRVSGAKINIGSPNKEKGTVTQKSVTIKGNPLQIKIATDMIEKCVAEDKRNRENDAKNREPRGKHASSDTSNQTVGNDLGTKGSSPQNAPPAGSSGALLEVFVSAVSSPSRFWLQIVGPQVEELDKLIDQMTEYYSNADNRDLHKLSDIQIGQMVAAVFRYDGKWYRAKVVEIKPHEYDPTLQVCDVHFVDFGDNEYVAKHELLSLCTDMLRLRFQAVECFLSGVGPTSNKEDSSDLSHSNRWDNHAIERFEELTQVARWKRLWSRTCTFKERTVDTSLLPRSSREGSPVPGVKLYDTKEGKDIDIGKVMVDEGWAVEVENETLPPKAVASTPVPTPTASMPPPSFGDLECSRVLGMVTNREERSSSLPHGGSSPSTSPRFDHELPDDSSFQPNFGSVKPKSTSLAAGMDQNTNSQPLSSSSINSMTDLSYGKAEVNGKHVNGSPSKSQHNGDFLNSERVASSVTNPILPHKPKPQPFHMPDPKDELKAKMNRIDSHHGSLEAMVQHTPPPSIVNSPLAQKSPQNNDNP